MKAFKEIIIGASLGAGIVFGLAFAHDARADGGNDPNLMANANAMCSVLNGADNVNPVHELFLVFGRQYTVDSVHAVCPTNDLKVYAGLLSYVPTEDAPDWDCAVDGNKVCGTRMT